mgnify:FL=1
MDKKQEPKKEPWRMPPDFRLVDFHKPLLGQFPVQLLITGITGFVLIALTIALQDVGGGYQ